MDVLLIVAGHAHVACVRALGSIAQRLPVPAAAKVSAFASRLQLVHTSFALAVFIGVIGAFTWRVISGMLRMGARRRYAKIALEHRRLQGEKIEAFKSSHPLPNDKLCAEIYAASVKRIAEQTASGRWRAEDVVLAYCWRAAEAHEATNCLTEIFFTEAVQLARTLDALPAEQRENQPLFGVPVSLKDNMDVGGFPSSCGFISWREKLALRNSAATDLLIAAGAVPFCKTNVPQTMRSFECRNPLWGTTDNPHRRGFIPGGSSGGEAALIGAGGSVLGLGNDVAGSLRLPAHCCGIASFKPSSCRITQVGVSSQRPAPGPVLHAVCGPMARNVADLVPMLDALYGRPATGEASGSCDVVPLHGASFSAALEAAKQATRGSKLRFGVIKNLDSIAATPACVRAVKEAAEALSAAGHDVVPFELPFSMDDVCRLVYSALGADGGHFDREALRDEPMDEVLAPFHYLMSMPRWAVAIFTTISRMYADRRPRMMLESLRSTDAVGVMRISALRAKLMASLADAWDVSGLDALIMPAMASPALQHGCFTHTSMAASYSFLWNVVDWPAGVVPVTRVDAELDAMPLSMRPGKHLEDAANVMRSDRVFEAELAFCYDAPAMAGLPVGVQVVTPRFAEAQCVNAMLILEESLPAH